MPYLINIFGAPGSGKSTFAMYLASRFKLMGLDSEFAPEYIKTLIANNDTNFDQLDILHNQTRQIKAFYNKADYVFTDSPILLTKIYAKSCYKHYQELSKLAEALSSDFNNFNILLKPCKENQYKSSLRLHSYNESLSLFEEFKQLTKYDIVINNFFNLKSSELDEIIFNIYNLIRI